MDRIEVLEAMHEGNITSRTFTIYVGNGYVDKSLNTERGLLDVAVCAEIIGSNCYIEFASGCMEQVLDDLVCVHGIHTPAGVRLVMDCLRLLGVRGRISVCAEYDDGCPVDLYTKIS